MGIEPALEVVWPAFCDPKLAAGLVESAEDARDRLEGPGGKVSPGLGQVHLDDLVDGLALPATGGRAKNGHEAISFRVCFHGLERWQSL
jgi:hypothetical protein